MAERNWWRFASPLGAIVAAAILYRLLLRRSILNWGATDAEANAWLPGDELLERADGVATRAITIDAPASAVHVEPEQVLDPVVGVGAASRRRTHLRNPRHQTARRTPRRRRKEKRRSLRESA
jgi:hypothetical protein